MASHNVCFSGRGGIGTAPSTVASLVSKQQAVAFYERKTQEILKRYGPGPRVHYHTGLVDQPPSIGASSEELRRDLVGAQERTLEYAAEVWEAASSLCGDVLDVGCGLGGGAIFWAQKFGANVTAVTIAPSHIRLVEGFAAQARVASRVQAVCCDVLTMEGEGCFDAAVAIDSSDSIPRRPWFRRLEGLCARKVMSSFSTVSSDAPNMRSHSTAIGVRKSERSRSMSTRPEKQGSRSRWSRMSLFARCTSGRERSHSSALRPRT
jgi:methyltransferase family protein